jgi:hypothetical protein
MRKRLNKQPTCKPKTTNRAAAKLKTLSPQLILTELDFRIVKDFIARKTKKPLRPQPYSCMSKLARKNSLLYKAHQYLNLKRGTFSKIYY